MNMYVTYKYRIKDSSSRKKLKILADKVNFVWNYCNDVNRKNVKKYFRSEPNSYLNEFNFNKLLSGSSKELGLHSQTIESIAQNYVAARDRYKKIKFRSYKRNLGWIPFKSDNIKILNKSIIYRKKSYKIWLDRSLPTDAKIKCGSFNEDSKGRWFVNVTFESKLIEQKHLNPNKSIGIDLGIKDLMTLSDGTKIDKLGITKKYQDKLAMAQRAKKKKLVTAINSKIKNVRKDSLHKISTKLCQEFGQIAVGDVSSQRIVDLNLSKNMNSAVYDSGWYLLKTLFKYKAIKLGGVYEEVDESYSTQDCSKCSSRCGPQGTAGLKVRNWICVSCGAKHDRDVNSAKNILKRFGKNSTLPAISK